MSETKPRLKPLVCLSALIAAWPSASFALGLGEIHLNSALNEPLSADIDLVSATPDELTALRASLAGRDAFQRYGIDRPPFLSSLTFTVGKGKDGRDALLVRSTDAIPEPFVTFLVEVNWSRGRLVREYTVLLDPPTYTPGENSASNTPVAPASTGSPAPRPAAQPAAAPSAQPGAPRTAYGPRTGTSASPGAVTGGGGSGASTYSVVSGDTLTKIAHGLRPGGSNGEIDQTMMALYRANPDAFGGNINILRRGAVLRVPGADQIAAQNQSEAIQEVHRQMSAWRNGGAESASHLRLVTPNNGTPAPTAATPAGTAPAGGGSSATGAAAAQARAENAQLRERVKDLESQVAESHRLIDVRNGELAALQRKLGMLQQQAQQPAPPPATTPPPAQSAPPAATTVPPPAAVPPAAVPPEATPPSAPPSAATPPPESANPPVVEKKPESGSWIDWIAEHWWVPAAVIVALIVMLAMAAQRRRRSSLNDLDRMGETDVADPPRPAGAKKGAEAFVVEESGEHAAPPTAAYEPGPEHLADTVNETLSAEDTLSSESAVNLDQGDPLAEADFHMAYGLYDQAADLVRIALEREPERRDLRLKLLEIYFVWGNKDAFLQTARELESTRDRAPPGEWDKIVIMGRQIAPEDPMFTGSAGMGRGAGALVDLNLEGGENRVDIDLFGEPEGERSVDRALGNEHEDIASTAESPAMHAGSDLDFTLDAPERGADDSPTREMPPRDEPTVESELMGYHDAPTAESPMLAPHDRLSSKLPNRTEQTAEVSIDDLGLDLDSLEETDQPRPIEVDDTSSQTHLEESTTQSGLEAPTLDTQALHTFGLEDHLEDHLGLDESTQRELEATDHPSDAPTMVAGLDEKSRRLMEEADKSARERDLTELERELEASFIADLGLDTEDGKTAVMGPESAPTVQMPRDFDVAATSRFEQPEFSEIEEKPDVDSTSKLKGLAGDSIDLDLDHLANALGSGDTVEQPRSDDELFSSEVFNATQNRPIDLDVGESLSSGEAHSSSEASTNKLQAISQTARTARIKAGDELSELEPVTMSEVGTKLDLARAYMDMGDPEGARSILEEVVQEGSASQKQEAQRLIETLPG